MSEFTRELTALLSKYSIEDESDTPDFILSEYLNECLSTFAKIMDKRENWYGRRAEPVEQPNCCEMWMHDILSDLDQSKYEHDKRGKI
jgi:hypothetical protein